MDATTPPLSPDRLSRTRLRLRKTVPMQGLGAHLRRMAGQSMEFRDYRSYHFGDDIRLVDWRASVRNGPDRDWFLKVFEAEQRMSLMIVVDDRAAMRLPRSAEKLLYALWVLRALARVAAEAGDAIVLIRMFSPGAPIIKAEGRGCEAAAREFAERIWRDNPASLHAVPVCDPGRWRVHLRPSSAVVLLSDLLFADPDNRIAGFLRKAQKSWRQLFVQPLDSAAQELALLRRTDRLKVADTEGRVLADAVFERDAAFEASVRRNIDHQIETNVASWRGPGLVVESPVIWPDTPGRDALAEQFHERFLSSGLFRGIAARGGLG
ncbi:DUF58 domain-containing protein [Rhodovulum sp. P5]|uniref:DUF58 domain-containing protein n=1 Tax=Rhodovulum sp. P5 TaxID=1564506 RepID=UPI0009DAEEB9|nr:DUF58 domain-containing protein [Rhodovulum sp. P5]